MTTSNNNSTTYTAYFELEDWSSRGDSRRQDEAAVDAILSALSQDELAAMYAEQSADERPLMDALERRVEDAVFANWESRPRSGHSIIITVEAGA